MPPLLIARPSVRWRTPLAALLIAVQHVVGIIALALRVGRVILSLAADSATHAEQRIAARTGVRALSDSGIRAVAAAFAHEFLTAYHQPTR